MTDQNGFTNALATIHEETSQWELMRKQAHVLVASGFLPKAVQKPEAAIAIMQTGREFGLQPMESFRHIHIINGSPVLAAGFMAALVQQYCEKHGGYLRQTELTHDRCVIEYRRGNWPEAQTFTFSLDDAKAAGLAGKDNWKKHPREMLYNRAVANACRMGWPELVSGVYDPDELGGESLEPTYTIEPSRGPVSGYVPDDVPAYDVRESESEPVANAITERQIRLLHAMAEEREKDHQWLHDLAMQRHGVETIIGLSRRQASQLIDNIIANHPVRDFDTGEVIDTQATVVDDAKPDIGSEIVEEFLSAIYDAQSKEQLVIVGKKIADSGISDQDLRDAYQTRLRELSGPKQAALAGAKADADSTADKHTN
jgi:hypothetical protein